MNVKDSIFHQPDVSDIAPLDVSGTRSDNAQVVFLNDYGRYEMIWCYWDDVDKCFKRSSSGEIINLEAVRQA